MQSIWQSGHPIQEPVNLTIPAKPTRYTLGLKLFVLRLKMLLALNTFFCKLSILVLEIKYTKEVKL
jgi:hypothetical protein